MNRLARWRTGTVIGTVMCIGIFMGIVLLLGWPATMVRAAEPITVAVSANLQPAFAQLAQRFQQQTGLTAQGSFASTGKLSAQIRQGAPFHLLLAADSDYPNQLQQAGYALQAPRVYALGTLVIWTSGKHALDNWQQLLTDPAIVHIAIADPNIAPYGREAGRVLQHYHLLRTVQNKLVYGESIGQTNQFIATGVADIGFTAKSSVINVDPRQWRELDTSSYHPIAQAAVLLKYADQHQRQTAERFYQFMFSADAQAILQAFGYSLPAAPAAASTPATSKRLSSS
ncbi:MAG TPA: molybdate ABC transporter substrate-binding protein [Permianibacter sp.]|nr:molybdate ABC transporter substrate-binding protein [Permianibacter sp.]